MQEICKSRIGWDHLLTGELLYRRKKLIDALQEERSLSLPRHYFKGKRTESIQLYGFCDASVAAYAAVVYIVETSGDQRMTSFVVSKTRVAPLKTQTIPRLELLLLARLITNVAESLTPRYSLMPHVCFSDSQVALCWIKGIN